MQKKATIPYIGHRYDDRKRNGELIDVLTAISIVSKRLARCIAEDERGLSVKKEGGGKHGAYVRT